MKPGDKVVCIDDSTCKCPICIMTVSAQSGLILNNVYVLSNVFNYYNFGYCCSLLGFPEVDDGTHAPNTFKLSRFRLLDELKQQAAKEQYARTH